MSRRYPISLALLAILFLVSGLGCSSRLVEPFSIPEGERLSEQQLSEVLGALDQRSESIQSVKALARVRFVSSESVQSFRWAIVFNRPNSARIETFPLNTFFTLQLMVSRHERFTVLIPAEELAATGRVTVRRIDEYLGIPLTLEEALPLLLGVIPQSVLSQAVRQGALEAVWLEKPNLVELVDRGEQRFRARVRVDQGIIEEIALRDPFDERLSAVLSIDSVRTVSGIVMPQNLVLQLPRSSQEFQLQLGAQAVNEPIREDLFELDIPLGFTVRELDR